MKNRCVNQKKPIQFAVTSFKIGKKLIAMNVVLANEKH